MHLDVPHDRRDKRDRPGNRSLHLHTFQAQLAHWHNGSSCAALRDKSDSRHPVHRVFLKGLVFLLCDALQWVDGRGGHRSIILNKI